MVTARGDAESVAGGNWFSLFALACLLFLSFSAVADEAKILVPKPLFFPPAVKLPEGPLRYENITDNEVRQIQSALPADWKGDILNISGVMDGCFCEAQTSCSAQVSVLIRKNKKQRHLIFSRMNEKWGIGDLQKWWLDQEKLVEVCASERVRKDKDMVGECARRKQLMLLNAPVCESK